MTRKDYVKFAAMLAGEMAIAQDKVGTKREVAVDAVRCIILMTADIFAQDNPRFDRQRFYEACGL